MAQFSGLCPAGIEDIEGAGWWRWEEADELKFGHIKFEVSPCHPVTSEERDFAKETMLANCTALLI